jgi:hypothetical protein
VVNVLRNDSASGRLVLAQSTTIPADSKSIALLLADVNGDGAKDVVTLSTSATVAAGNVHVALTRP